MMPDWWRIPSKISQIHPQAHTKNESRVSWVKASDEESSNKVGKMQKKKDRDTFLGLFQLSTDLPVSGKQAVASSIYELKGP